MRITRPTARPATRPATRPTVVVALLATGVVAGTVAAAAPVSAAPPPQLHLVYDTTGSTTLTNPDSKVTVTFKPSVLTTSIDLNQTPAVVTANLPLAPVKAGFKAYGFLPASGTVVFTQVRPVKGLLDLGNLDRSLTATAYYVVSLRDVVIGGAAADVGPSCQTVYPVKVAIHSEPDFAALSSGTFTGVYDLGGFQNCGRAQKIINDTLPGKANTLTLKVQIQDDTPARAALAAAGHAPRSS